ncbi:MAG TPA: HAD-IB family phosphatase [Candidatus Methanofastidiosa archaeon]|nr:HAD-IB family phosphatase [Candidatus Methanofastidiosa archaeon]
MFKLVMFDLDGTLIESISSWRTLHRYFGASQDEVERNTEAFFSGRIDYLKWMEDDIALWLHRRPTIADIEDAFSSCSPPPDSKEAVSLLKSNGMKVYIVSSGIDVLADRIGRELGVDGVFANALNADEEGYLNGNGTLVVEPNNKHEVVMRIAEADGVPLDQVACVGDTKYDISMFEGVGGKYALNSKHQELVDAADEAFDDILELAKHIISHK